MLVPLYGFVEGDTMGVLVLAGSDMTVAEVAAKLKASAALRAGTEGPWVLMLGERTLRAEATVFELGLKALARVDLRRRYDDR